MSYIYLREQPAVRLASTPNGLGVFGDGSEMAEVNEAIRRAEVQMKAAEARIKSLTAAGGVTSPGLLAEMGKFSSWANEAGFLKNLKPLYEPQTGVPIKFTNFPVTKIDPVTKSSGPNTTWRVTPTRQAFDSSEAGGSFCLGSSRAMAFRSLFGLDRPKNIEVLTDLKNAIEAAKSAKDVGQEGKLLISRIVSHLHDPGSLKQFNEDLEKRYNIKNVIVKNASRTEAFEVLKKGAPIMADLEGGWHWVVVHRSPLGQLWANDPLQFNGIRKIAASDLGSRFELIVNAQNGEPITPAEADKFKK